MLQLWEQLIVGRIELVLSNAGERTEWHHERRLIEKSGVSISKSCRARVWVAGARGETHIHRGFPSLNPGLESCGEIGIEEESGPHSILS